MGDDPYDFDIAIPAGKAGAGKSTAWDGGRHAESDDSDASESGSGGRSSSGSDVSLSDSEDFRSKKKASAASKTPTSRTTGGTGGAAGSSALDKAKSFLSKYSTKPASASAAASKAPTTSSTRSRRLEMSLDDEDFSLDSSGEEIKKPKAKAVAAASSKSKAARKELSESEQSEAEESSEEYGKPAPAVTPVSKPSRYEESDEDEEDRPRSTVARIDTKPAHTPVASRYESDDDAPDSPAPVRSVTWTPAGYGATLSKPTVAADDDVDSVASQSELEESDAPRPIVTASIPQPVPAKPREISAVSDSGVYDEEDFDDDSVQVNAATPAKIPDQAPTRVAVSQPREEESNFDYSLDFAEDPETSSPPLPPSSFAAKTVVEEQDHAGHLERRSRSLSSTSESTPNVYADGGGDGDGVHDGDEDDESRDESERTPPESKPNYNAVDPRAALQESENYSQDYGFESASMAMATSLPEAPVEAIEDRVPAPTTTIRDSNFLDTATKSHHGDGKLMELTTDATARPLSVGQPTRSRPRVVIVREYEQMSKSVEKRDASTQFTGNHASIQTDLTPDGMFSSSERKAYVNTPVVDQPVVTEESPPIFDSIPPPQPTLRQPQAGLPGPPPSPFVTYGLYDPLQLPVATSMSIYKQQLMALQQQIHQKKLETERLFRDRMASRYSSLRGTDKFLAANRPTKIPLWEALQRVDPTLDERRAKEIASHAGDTTT